MKKRDVAAVALLLGASAALGMVAVTRTTSLGRAAAARRVATDPTLTARADRLDQIAASLRRSLAQRPPKLPPVPVVHAVPSTRGIAPASAPQRVIYQRPAPIVIVQHASHADDREPGDGGDGGGGGGDG